MKKLIGKKKKHELSDMNTNNIQLRLNLIKRAIITYYPYPGSAVVVDLSSDGTIKLNDNGIEKAYVVDKDEVVCILHTALGGVFFEDISFEKSDEVKQSIDWKIEFYNRRKLDHIAYGTEGASLYAFSDLISALRNIERMIGADLGIKHLNSLLETKKDDCGKSAVVSKEMRSVYYKIMTNLLNMITEKPDPQERNILISPLSLFVSMAMVREAASGVTREELDRLFDNRYDQVEQDLATLINDFSRAVSQLRVANALYVEKGFADQITDSYSDCLNNKFKADRLSAEPGIISKVVNDWVDQNTQGMIKKLIRDDDILNNIAFLNAVVFEAKWLRDYMTHEVKTKDFHNMDGSIVKTPMLCSEEDRLLINNKVQGVMKQYSESEYCFVGLLPNEGYSVEQILKEMTPSEWMTLFDRSRKAKVDAWIPEYKFEYEKDLTSTLKQLGLLSAFDKDKADLSNMIMVNSYVEKVVQKTFIDVNRKGTRAAAVAGWVACAAGAPQVEEFEVHLDRPFIFAIVHRSTSLPVFIGIVNSLSQ